MTENSGNTILDNNDIQNEMEYAMMGVRFANYLIDVVVFYAVVIAFTLLVLQMGISNLESPFSSIALSALCVLIYWGGLEALTKGRTIGKLITGTVALMEDGSVLTSEKAFQRALCRIIPFEAFSFLGNNGGWHDTISKTTVIKYKKPIH